MIIININIETTATHLREGILYDLALVMCNETLFPVAKMQVVIITIVIMIIVNMMQVSK